MHVIPIPLFNPPPPPPFKTELFPQLIAIMLSRLLIDGFIISSKGVFIFHLNSTAEQKKKTFKHYINAYSTTKPSGREIYNFW